jgi:hypothetical protein
MEGIIAAFILYIDWQSHSIAEFGTDTPKQVGVCKRWNSSTQRTPMIAAAKRSLYGRDYYVHYHLLNLKNGAA